MLKTFVTKPETCSLHSFESVWWVEGRWGGGEEGKQDTNFLPLSACLFIVTSLEVLILAEQVKAHGRCGLLLVSFIIQGYPALSFPSYFKPLYTMTLAS